MNKLYVIADLGRVRAFALKEGSEVEGLKDRLAELSENALDTAVDTRGSVTTDKSGRFAQGSPAGSNGGMSYGEEHQLASEIERKNLDRIATHIDGVIRDSGYPFTVLAAPQAILSRLESALDRRSQDAIGNRVGADLTKEPMAKLEKRFL